MLSRAQTAGHPGQLLIRIGGLPDGFQGGRAHDPPVTVRVEEHRIVEAMHRGVIACAPEANGLSVARVMAAHRIHSVVVKSDDGRPHIVTDTELAAAIYAGRIQTCTAAEIARPAPVLRLSDSIAFALHSMDRAESTHAVVVGHAGRALGVVSILDLVERLLSEQDRLTS
jgi:CBS domain-containing protein